MESDFEASKPELLLSLHEIDKKATALKRLGASKIIMLPIPSKLNYFQLREPIALPSSEELSLVNRKFEIAKTGLQGDAAFAKFYAWLRLQLSERGLEPVDLLTPFTPYAHTNQLLYRLDDTHWSDLGITVAAQTIFHELWPSVRPEIIQEPPHAEPPVEEGNLQQYLMMPPSSRFAWAYPHYRLSQPQGVFRPTHIILLGTSYSVEQNYKLGKLLARFPNTTVTDLSIGGRGPVASYQVLMARYTKRIPGSIIVWEFPVRNVLSPKTFEEAKAE